MSYRLNVITAVLFSAILVTSVSAKDPKDQGFSGKWVMDRNSSHGTEQIDDLRQNIKVHGSEMTIQSVFAEPKTAIAPLLYLGIMTSALKISTNGEETENQIGPYVFLSKTTMDGNKMTTEWRSQINGDPVQGRWVRTLSDDGKQMTIEITENSTKDQKGDAKLVFNRK